MRAQKNIPKWQLIILILLGVLLTARFILNLVLQFPAINGDSILFASVANYHCTTGRFETPIFPLDPSGGIRYVWHGVVHPAVLSWLALGCGAGGLYLAQTFLMLVTVVCAWLFVRAPRGMWWAVCIAVALVALQTKQGFRPEATAMLLVLITEWLRSQRHSVGWMVLAGVQAWLHPTAFIFYVAYVLLSTGKDEVLWLFSQWRQWLLLTLASQVLLLWMYPFPIADLFQGLALQGETFAARSDGSIWTYHIRSDLFPLFGLVFLATLLTVSLHRPVFLLLLPLCWYYGVRVPPTYYNLLPLWVCLAWFLTVQMLPSSLDRWSRRVVFGSAVLASVGLFQSVARDTHSWFKYGASLSKAQETINEIESQGLVVCGVPAYFTLIYPSGGFSASHQPQWHGCEKSSDTLKRDLVSPTAIKERKDASSCTAWPLRSTGLPGLSAIFKTDSGYSFYVCPHESTV